MKNSVSLGVLLLCTLVAGLLVAPAGAKEHSKTADRTVVYFGAPW
jgi:hypothetical protein